MEDRALTPSPAPSTMGTFVLSSHLAEVLGEKENAQKRNRGTPGAWGPSLRQTRSYADSREQPLRERLQLRHSTGSKVSVVWEWRNSSHH